VKTILTVSLYYITIFYLFNLGKIYSQPIPDDFFLEKQQNMLYDNGINWKTLTCFNPLRFQQLKSIQNSDTYPYKINYMIGGGLNNNDLKIFGYGLLKYRKYFYAYISPKLSTESGNRKTSILTEYSGIGFQNSWLKLQIGKGRENWGAGENIELALNINSQPYEYFMLGSNYGNVRVNYIHGSLETLDNNIFRYITARGLEWTNNKSLIIGISETIIYSGINRPIDIGYINPISTHLEVELNRRLNKYGDEFANAVWQLHADMFFKEKIRISTNILFDEFVIDPDLEIGKEHGRALSVRGAYKPNQLFFRPYFSYVFVGTPTFRHGNGSNNFVHNGSPLGWEKGSDSREIKIGFNYLNKNKMIASVSGGIFTSGEENILKRIFDPYADYLKDKFPSGVEKKSKFLDIYMDYKWKYNLVFKSKIRWEKGSFVENDGKEISLGISYLVDWY